MSAAVLETVGGRPAASFFARLRGDRMAFAALLLLLLLVAASIAAPLLSPHAAYEVDLASQRLAPSLTHPFGTDDLGRDVLVRTLHAGRTTMLVGGAAVLFALLIGVTAGAVAGYRRGLLDSVIMRAADMFLSIPVFLVVVVIAKLVAGIELVPGWRRHFILLAIVLLIGAAIFLGNELEDFQQARVQDQVSYNALARSLLAGRGYSFEQDWYPGFTKAHKPTAHWSFLYPLYLSGVYSITGYYPLAARIVQAVFSGILSIWLLFRLGKRLSGETLGLITAGLGAIYPYFIFHDAALMTESFFILGILVMLNLSIAIIDTRNGGENHYSSLRTSISAWLIIGIVFGVTAILRQTILLWLPFWLFWIYWAGWKQIKWWEPIITLAVIALFIIPWSIRNYLIYEDFLLLNSNSGYALYSANHPNHGTQFDQDYAAPLPEDLVSQGLNEAQWNSALTIRGLQFILQDPHRYLLLSLDRVGIFFNFWISPESNLSSNLMRVLSYGLYLPFFIYGLILSLREWKRYSLIYLFTLSFSAMHILTWASIRYRLPVDAALMPLAALALVDIIIRLQTRLGNAS